MVCGTCRPGTSHGFAFSSSPAIPFPEVSGSHHTRSRKRIHQEAALRGLVNLLCLAVGRSAHECWVSCGLLACISVNLWTRHSSFLDMYIPLSSTVFCWKNKGPSQISEMEIPLSASSLQCHHIFSLRRKRVKSVLCLNLCVSHKPRAFRLSPKRCVWLFLLKVHWEQCWHHRLYFRLAEELF